MLLLNPRRVTFGGQAWHEVSAVTVDRKATREIIEWSDEGPHVVLADVAEQRVIIRVVQDVCAEDLGAPDVGVEGELVLHTAPASGDAGRKRVSASAVVLSVSHEVSLKRGAVRTVTLVAVSDDGASDPVTVESAIGGAA